MDEKSRETRTWIKALGLLENHDQNGDDLRPLLLDGTLLCRLVNRLKPGTIEKVKEWLFLASAQIGDAFCHVNYAQV